MIKTARLFAFGAAAGAAALLSAAPAAKAQTTTFAQYFQNNPGTQSFTLTNTGAASTLTSTATPVLFNYAGGTVNASFTFNASGAALATSSTSGGVTSLSQTFTSYEFRITAGGVNYLSGFGNNLVLSGTSGGGASTLNVSTPPADDVKFTSSVISDVETAAERNFAIGLSSVNPVLAIETTGPNVGYIRGFTAASGGTFAKSAAAVPEPGMVTFALTSGAGLAGMVLRGRRRSKKAA